MKILILSLFIVGLITVDVSSTSIIPTDSSLDLLPATDGATSFAGKLFNTIGKNEKYMELNLAFSPFTFRTVMAIVYAVSDGPTADEMKEFLQLTGNSKEEAFINYATTYVQPLFNRTDLLITNGINIKTGVDLAHPMNQLLTTYLTLETVTGDDTKTSLICLADAINFNAKWEHPFKVANTEKREFSVSATDTKFVDTMSQINKFLYGELKDLDATAVEFRFKQSNIAFLVILPNSVDGLSALEEKLLNVDLTQLKGFTEKNVQVELPKFDLKVHLSLLLMFPQWGLLNILNKKSLFEDLTSNRTPLEIHDIFHMTRIKVEEMEEPSDDFFETQTVPKDLIYFSANHAFAFAVKDNVNVYFAGHVRNPLL